jgi:Rhodopirellula transposase DDE domain
MGADDAVVAVLAAKFAEYRPHADERRWRVYLGSEARAHAALYDCPLSAAVSVVAAAAGVSRSTVAAGAGELAVGAEPLRGRQRRPGAGRPKADGAQPGLSQALDGVLEDGTCGDPMREIAWTTLSLRGIARKLRAEGFEAGKDAVSRMMRARGYSLQGMSRVLEGKQHPDRDRQFRHVNAMIAWFREHGLPVISVDGKKKEQLGPFRRDGASWRPAGDPVRVRDHDFPDEELGKITPYGVYDIAANRGFVSVGTSHDTGAFAVNAIRLWWQEEGQFRYPGAGRLLITCDAGGSNGHRCRLWKNELAAFAAGAGLKISVCHFPPGTSKWNKIEHRMFCHITRTWKARPLMTAADAVAGITATVTAGGLKCRAVLDDRDYPGGIKISDRQMRYLERHVIIRHGPHPDWNYTTRPAPAPAPGPGPAGPDPALITALAALAGLPGPDGTLPAQLTLEWNAAREHQLTLERGGTRRRAGGGYRKLSPEAILAAAACRIRPGMTWALLARLLGVHESSISVPAGWATPVLEKHGITAPPGKPRITTPAQLLEHAAAAGITLTISPPQPGTPPRTTAPEDHDTPETAD